MWTASVNQRNDRTRGVGGGGSPQILSGTEWPVENDRPESPQTLVQAIAMVGRRKDDELTGHLVDYLVDGAEQTLKNHNLLFKLHLELGDFDQAAKMAVLIARQEQVS